MKYQAHIAVDLGAESGRVIVGTLHDNRLALHETHRFQHMPRDTPEGLCWDTAKLWNQILAGLKSAAVYAKEEDLELLSVGVDTWGVDFTLLNPNGETTGPPRCYRDPAFDEAFRRVTAVKPARQIYEATGIQLMGINSLYQYESRYRQSPEYFANGHSLLFTPDLMHYLLSGQACVERTIASTSQMVDPRTGDWNRALLNDLNLPATSLITPTPPGAVIGTLREEVATQTGLPATVKFVLPPSHDTASAVASVPAVPGTKWCYLSSGTWSLLGVELNSPCITDASAEANFTNELGVSNTVRFLKNIAGLFLVQEVRRDLQRQGQSFDYSQLTQQAAESEPHRTLVPVSSPAFSKLGGAVERIQNFARTTGQPVPETVGQLVRCCLESLTLEYRTALRTMEEVLGESFDVLHIVGGGGKNILLNEMTSQATGKQIVVGPDEGTAMGNILTQAMGTGRLSDLDAIRAVVRNSIELTSFSPHPSDDWNVQAKRYQHLREG